MNQNTVSITSDADLNAALATIPDFLIDGDNDDDGALTALDNEVASDEIAADAVVEPKKAGKKTAAKKGASKKKAEPEVPEVKAEAAGAADEGEPEPAAAAPEEKKEPRLTYVTSSKSAVLRQKLGAAVSSYLMLDMADAMLEGDALKARIDEVLESIDACGQKKVQEKAVMLFTWMHKGGQLNEVMDRAFRVLLKDGEIVTGEKGNLHASLLAKPYSVGTARAQAGQIVTLFPLLKITSKDKGRLVANEDSLILAKVKAEFKM